MTQTLVFVLVNGEPWEEVFNHVPDADELWDIAWEGEYDDVSWYEYKINGVEDVFKHVDEFWDTLNECGRLAFEVCCENYGFEIKSFKFGGESYCWGDDEDEDYE